MTFKLQIVHVTALKATTIKDQKYNLGNVEFELSLTSGSKIRLYGHHNSKEVEQMKATAINLKDICKFVDKKICKYDRKEVLIYNT